MSVIPFGILDIIGGGAIALTALTTLHGNNIVFFFAVIFLFKGIWSILAAAMSGFYFDILGIIDLLASLLLFLINAGFQFGFFFYIGIILMLKGFYSVVIGLMQ